MVVLVSKKACKMGYYKGRGALRSRVLNPKTLNRLGLYEAFAKGLQSLDGFWGVREHCRYLDP